MGLKKNVFTLEIPPWAPHTFDFVVLTSLMHPSQRLISNSDVEREDDRWIMNWKEVVVA
jgi:hypothetical protein